MYVYLITERDIPGFKEVIQSRDIGSPSVWHPPLTSVLIVELYLTHHVRVVPVSKHNLCNTTQKKAL